MDQLRLGATWWVPGWVIRWWRDRAVSVDRRVAVRGERLAAQSLRGQGYHILGRGLRTRFGEVDILAQAPDSRTVVVVEVKSRAITPAATMKNGPLPEERVGGRKQRRLTALAVQLARRYQLTDRPIRFDVIGVDVPIGPHGSKPLGRALRGLFPGLFPGEGGVRHHVGAFESRV